MSSSSSKPRVLLFGGTGFVGRHLVKLLLNNNLVSKIRVVDKTPAALAYFTPEFKSLFESPLIEFVQANCSNAARVKKAFQPEEGGAKFNIVINLAAETRYGQEESVYKQMVFDVAVNVAKEAAIVGCDKFIEVSTAQVYEAGKKASKEKDKLKPWTKLAKYKAQAEEEIKKLKNLQWVILRPATIYGPGDLNGLSPRIICAATYTLSKSTMKLLWTGDMRIDVVNVEDVVNAIWLAVEKAAPGTIYNICDKSELTQKKLNEIFHELFGIDTGFWGSVLSNLAQLKIKDAAETANETHMNPWSDMLKASGITRTPLSPYIDVELLYNTPLSIDGTAIEALGFTYKHPTITSAHVLGAIKYWQDLQLFPQYKKLEK